MILTEIYPLINLPLISDTRENADVNVLVAQWCPTLCDPTDYNPPGSSVHGTLQARLLEWVVISFSRGSSPPGNQTRVSCFVGGLYHVNHQESPEKMPS